MNDLGFYLGLHPVGALAIVVSTILLYLAFSGVLAVLGQRMFASPSSLDLAVVTVLGAIVGRAILGQEIHRAALTGVRHANEVKERLAALD